MSTNSELSDGRLLDLLRVRGSLSVGEAAEACEVTATAVRQRLTRLMSQGLVKRTVQRLGRGRPEHRYAPSEKARRQVGNNYADLAMVLWNELRSLPNDEIRRGLLQRVADQMMQFYRSTNDLSDATPATRLEALRQIFADRRLPVDVRADGIGDGPVLTVIDCPYPELAQVDRSICAMEKLMLQDWVNQPVRLAQCRLDGHSCCQFETRSTSDTITDSAPAATF